MPAPLVLVPGLLCTEALFAPQIAVLRDVTSITSPITPAMIPWPGSRATSSPPHRRASPWPGFPWASSSRSKSCAKRRRGSNAWPCWTAVPSSTTTTPGRAAGVYLEMARNGRFMEITRDHLLQKLIHPAAAAEPDAALEWRRRLTFLRQETALLDRDDYMPLLPEIRCPTLVVVGEADAIISMPMAERLAAGYSRRAAGSDRRQRPSHDLGAAAGDDGAAPILAAGLSACVSPRGSAAPVLRPGDRRASRRWRRRHRGS